MAIYVTRQYNSNYSYPSTIFGAGSWPQDYTRSWSLNLNIMDNFWPELKEHVVSISAKAKNNGASTSGSFYYQIISNSTQSRFQVYVHQSENIDIPVNLVEIRVKLDMYILSATPSSRFTIEGVDHNVLVFKPNRMEWVFDSEVDYKVRLDQEAHASNYNFISWDKLDLTKSYNKDIFPYYKTSNGVYHENDGTTILSTIPNGESLLMLKTASYLFNQINYLKNAWKSFIEKESIFEIDAEGTETITTTNPLEYNCYRNIGDKLQGIGNLLGLISTTTTQPQEGYRYQEKASHYFNLLDMSTLTFLGDYNLDELNTLNNDYTYIFYQYNSEYETTAFSEDNIWGNQWIGEWNWQPIDMTLKNTTGEYRFGTIDNNVKINDLDWVELKNIKIWRSDANRERDAHALQLQCPWPKEISNPTDITLTEQTDQFMALPTFYSSDGKNTYHQWFNFAYGNKRFLCSMIDKSNWPSPIHYETNTGFISYFEEDDFATSGVTLYYNNQSYDKNVYLFRNRRGSHSQVDYNSLEHKIYKLSRAISIPKRLEPYNCGVEETYNSWPSGYNWGYYGHTYWDGDQYDKRLDNSLATTGANGNDSNTGTLINGISRLYWWPTDSVQRNFNGTNKWVYVPSGNAPITNALSSWRSVDNNGNISIKTQTYFADECNKRCLVWSIKNISGN